MEFLRRPGGVGHSLGVLAGSFNPPTRAHLALAEAALDTVDRVLFALPRQFPHKTYDGVGLAARSEILCRAVAGEPRFGAAITEGGLFIDIARECRREFGEGVSLGFVCGRDAAERIVGWPYEDGQSIERMLEEFELLVAGRQGEYSPPPHLANRIRGLRLAPEYDTLSATDVRHRLEQGGDWRALVPETLHDAVARHYLGH